MVADIDGIRIISKYFCEFLQKVPSVLNDLCYSVYVEHALCVLSVAASVSVLRIGSLEPGAMLNDALKEFEVRAYNNGRC